MIYSVFNDLVLHHLLALIFYLLPLAYSALPHWLSHYLSRLISNYHRTFVLFLQGILLT